MRLVGGGRVRRSAFFQLLPGRSSPRLPLLVAGFLLGVTAQSIKLCVDTLVQAHVDDEFKGRVFVIYDMIFNVALVVAAMIGAAILPADGVSVPIIVALAVAYLLLGVWFARSAAGSAWTRAPSPSGSSRRTVAGSWTARRARPGAVGPPGQQLFPRPLRTQRALVDPQLQQEPVRLADPRAGRRCPGSP